MHIKLWSQNVEEGTHLENLDVDVIKKFKKTLTNKDVV
jgi:hypothetical protein